MMSAKALAAFAWSPAATWRYTGIVKAAGVRPNLTWTTRGWTPASMSPAAWACRRSWSRSSGNPSDRANFLKLRVNTEGSNERPVGPGSARPWSSNRAPRDRRYSACLARCAVSSSAVGMSSAIPRLPAADLVLDVSTPAGCEIVPWDK